ncbi:MAG: hypothetical protein PHH09_05555 [Methanoregulaceae archaeon]|nr:hypothetical protein [Methanoregulaceae archaeon]
MPANDYSGHCMKDPYPAPGSASESRVKAIGVVPQQMSKVK